MLGVEWQLGHALSYRTGPVVSQHAAVPGCTSLVFPACPRHWSKVSNHSGPIEPPVSGPSQSFGCLLVCMGPRLEQRIPAGTDYSFVG